MKEKSEKFIISEECKFNAHEYDSAKHDLFITCYDRPGYFIRVLGCQFRDDVESQYPVKVIFNDLLRNDDKTTYGIDIFTTDGKIYSDREYDDGQPNLIIKVPKGHTPMLDVNEVVPHLPESVPAPEPHVYAPVSTLTNGFVNVYLSKVKETGNTILTAGKVNLDYPSASKNAAFNVENKTESRFTPEITAAISEHIATINLTDHPAVKAVLIQKGLLL